MSKLSLSRAWEETTSVLARDGRLFVAVALALFVLPALSSMPACRKRSPANSRQPGRGLRSR